MPMALPAGPTGSESTLRTATGTSGHPEHTTSGAVTPDAGVAVGEQGGLIPCLFSVTDTAAPSAVALANTASRHCARVPVIVSKRKATSVASGSALSTM